MAVDSISSHPAVKALFWFAGALSALTLVALLLAPRFPGWTPSWMPYAKGVAAVVQLAAALLALRRSHQQGPYRASGSEVTDSGSGA